MKTQVNCSLEEDETEIEDLVFDDILWSDIDFALIELISQS